MSDERSVWAPANFAFEIDPGVVLRGNLGERAGSESPGQPVGLVETDANKWRRRKQRDPVFGKRCSRPQRATGLHG